MILHPFLERPGRVRITHRSPAARGGAWYAPYSYGTFVCVLNRLAQELVTFIENSQRAGQIDFAVVHHDSRFDLSLGALEQGLGPAARQVRQLHYDPRGTVAQLVVHGPQIDHEIAVDFAQLDHGGRGQRVEHELGGGAGFHPRGTGDDFRAHDRIDDDIRRKRSHRLGRARYENRRRPDLSCPLQGPAHKRRHSASGQPHHHVFATHTLPINSLGAVLRMVLRPFDGANQGPPAPGDDPLDQCGPDAERRRTLRGVKDAEPAAGAGADIEEAPARAEAIHDQVNRRGDTLALRADRLRHRPVLGVDQIDDLQGGKGVDVGASRIAFLGGWQALARGHVEFCKMDIRPTVIVPARSFP